jgi:uncharacterized iron-regulated protein
MTALLWLLLGLQGAVPPPVYVPQRVYDTRRQAFADFEMMVADLARADVIFIGEQHDDPNTHRLEAAVLEGLSRRGAAVTLSLEMFERDVQPALDAYLAGKTTEDEFLKSSRPWPRYATDYRALLEMASLRKWPVVASNVPRRYASQAAKEGQRALDGVAAAERGLFAQERQCPLDGYFDRFSASMTTHAMPGSEELSAEDRRTNLERFYVSQCLKDETMAESVAAALERAGRGPVVHVNGSFHSDFGQGTTERVRRRLDGRRVAVVSILPVKDLDEVVPSAEDLRRADYLVYTIK